MRNYRYAFLIALVGNFALIAVLGWLWWRSGRQPKMQAAMAASGKEMAQNSPNGGEDAPMGPHETALVPVQFSPERLQSIGVRMGRVQSTIEDDENRVTGTVAVGERGLSCDQRGYS